MFKSRASAAALLLCAGLYLFQLSFVWRYAVNIPYWDEWESFNPGQLPSGFSLAGLFAQHNEHRMVTMKLLVWALFYLDGWNLATHQVINFLIYGLLVGWIAWMLTRLAPGTPAWAHLGFVVFLLSTISIQSHTMGYQSAFHFWLLFFLAASHFLFGIRQKFSALAAGCAAAALSIFSLAAGVVSSLTLLAAFVLFKAQRARRAAARAGRRRELLQLLFVAASVAGAVALWAHGYVRSPQHPPTSPLRWEFWDYYLNVVSFGFGVDEVSAARGAVCLLIVLVPVCAQIARKRGDLTAAQWATLSTLAGVLAVLASTAVGRAGFGPSQAKASRYAEVGMALIPFSALAWGFLLEDRRRLKTAALTGLWVFCFAAYWNNWRFRDYRAEVPPRAAGVECVRRYYLRGGDALCPTIYPGSLAGRLDAARRINASFYRELDADESAGR